MTDGGLAFVNQDKCCGNQDEVKGKQGVGDDGQVGSVQDAVVEVDNGEVAESEDYSSWRTRRPPATVVVVPVNPDQSGWVTGVAEGNIDCVCCARTSY